MRTTPTSRCIPGPSSGSQGRRRTGILALLAPVLPAILAAGVVQAQSDNFDDGNDNGWTRYAPLAPYGVTTLFTFPNGGYRIQTTVPTGNPANPGRAGSFRTDVTYTDFYVVADLVNWNNDTHQAFGVLARIGTPGAGQTTGYAFTYERGAGVTPTSGDLDISRLDGEVPTSIESGSSSLHLDPTKDYRFVFIGKGPVLEGRIYELPNTTTPLKTITATDGTYPGGYGGLVASDLSADGNGVTDVTFDNYLALPEEPPSLEIKEDGGSGGLIVSWPATFLDYRLYSTPALPATGAMWTEERDVLTDGLVWYHGESWGSGNRFFRLAK